MTISSGLARASAGGTATRQPLPSACRSCLLPGLWCSRALAHSYSAWDIGMWRRPYEAVFAAPSWDGRARAPARRHPAAEAWRSRRLLGHARARRGSQRRRRRPPVAAALAPASTGSAGHAFLVTTPYSFSTCSPAPGATCTRGPGSPAFGSGWPQSPRIVTPLPRLGCGRKPTSLRVSGVAAPPLAPGGAEKSNTGGGWRVTSANTPAVLTAAGEPRVHMTRKLKGSGAAVGRGEPAAGIALARISPRIVTRGMPAPVGCMKLPLVRRTVPTSTSASPWDRSSGHEAAAGANLAVLTLSPKSSSLLRRNPVHALPAHPGGVRPK
ncbi:MAG: hypothetical protein J3K34DRAFT_418260 [Monoraphidium minutum]|nr:MAG: hypothetical protein J3K34DRAFT_418260 [Monoraphidium minutum]